jgi:exodeoxyribonuclease V gamma subunit
MDTQHQHTGHRLFPGFSIIHANHLEDLRQVAVGWIKAHPLQVLETEQFIVQSNGMALAQAGPGCGRRVRYQCGH